MAKRRMRSCAKDEVKMSDLEKYRSILEDLNQMDRRDASGIVTEILKIVLDRLIEMEKR